MLRQTHIERSLAVQPRYHVIRKATGSEPLLYRTSYGWSTDRLDAVEYTIGKAAKARWAEQESCSGPRAQKRFKIVPAKVATRTATTA
jgi:hypothetical protein